MEIRKLNAGDYDELLETLNTVFGNKNKKHTIWCAFVLAAE